MLSKTINHLLTITIITEINNRTIKIKINIKNLLVKSNNKIIFKKLNNMTPQHLSTVSKDVEENLILIASQNIKKFVKKYFRIKEKNLMHNNKESYKKNNQNL
jgi:hypothetical protein